MKFFVGRLTEIERLRRSAAATAHGRLEVAFLEGERGIGKSSLAAVVRVMAERHHKLLGIHAFLGGVSSLDEMARRVFDRLLNESRGRTWDAKITQLLGDHIKQVGLFGISVQFDPPQRALNRIVHNFAPALRNLRRELRGDHDGILLILDDINGLAGSEAFANWLKSLVDDIATAREPLPLFVLLVGLSERRHSLIRLQPSLARVLTPVELPPWSDAETREFFVEAFRTVHITVDPTALDKLVRYAGGLPVLAQEIGDAVYAANRDGRIDDNDAWAGLFTAADIVGQKHLEPGVFQTIRSDRSRAILRRMAEVGPFEVRFRRADLLAQLQDPERRVLDNFLRRMRDLGVIEPDPAGERGDWRFCNRLHLLYLWLETQRAAHGAPRQTAARRT